MRLVTTIVTCDRSPATNYLRDTLDSLAQSGYNTSARLERLIVSDHTWPFAIDVVRSVDLQRKLTVLRHPRDITPNEHVARALKYAASYSHDNAPGHWVIFLEDDIAVCSDFFQSTAVWLDDHASNEPTAPLVYPLASVHPNVLSALANDHTCARVPVRGFYGTQGFVIHASEALSLSAYLHEHQYDLTPIGTCWDLLMQKWALERRPDVDYFLTPAPSFLQHVGIESKISPRPNVHRFPSFDAQYSYVLHREALRV